MPEPSQSPGTRWDPSQYLAYADLRARPALELLARVPLDAPRTVVDLGCGPGNVTRRLAERWPAARVVGIDHSREMVARARAEPSAVEWLCADVSDWSPGAPVELVYSNATLHWVAGHAELFPRLFDAVAPGGVLAVQMPLSFDLPSHRLMRETLAEEPFGDEALRAAVGRRWVEDASFYYDALAPRAARIDVWETEYLQVLEGDDPVLEWVSGTGLRPILNGLEGEERERFLARYRERLRGAYPRRADGRTLYPFRRLFFVATR